MIFERPKLLIAVAIVLLLFGVVMPFLMASHLIESTLFLNFLSFFLSVLGLYLGLIGISGARIIQKHKDDQKNRYK
jgi:hypothetical protein